jgi:hypothetical protein
MYGRELAVGVKIEVCSRLLTFLIFKFQVAESLAQCSSALCNSVFLLPEFEISHGFR